MRRGVDTVHSPRVRGDVSFWASRLISMHNPARQSSNSFSSPTHRRQTTCIALFGHMEHTCSNDCPCRIDLQGAADALAESSRLLSESLSFSSADLVELRF